MDLDFDPMDSVMIAAYARAGAGGGRAGQGKAPRARPAKRALEETLDSLDYTDLIELLYAKAQEQKKKMKVPVPSAVHVAPAADPKVFDKAFVMARLDTLWSLPQEFGQEKSPFDVYLDGVIADRTALVNGLQLLRDELQFAGKVMKDKKTYPKLKNTSACVADLSLPSVICTLAHTSCGDRICQGAAKLYETLVGSRFASITETGEIKPEVFFPTGGGTDDGATLAHVTVAHMSNKALTDSIYSGNSRSFSLINMDLKTHCGKVHFTNSCMISDRGKDYTAIPSYFGSARESIWRENRTACGAVVGCLNGFNPDNGVHVRIRNDLGEKNYEFLSKHQIYADNGIPVTYLVAASIVAITGMVKAAKAMLSELDERGVASLTASVVVNMANVGGQDNILYLARATVFDGVITKQGLGREASKYSAIFVPDEHDGTIKLVYDGVGESYPIIEKRDFGHKASAPADH